MSNNKQVGEASSSEVANPFRSCRDLSDVVPLYPPRALYLKPLAKVNVSVSLPQLKTPGKTISTWEVMEKLRTLILPDEFASLKVTKSTLEFIRLEGDLRDRCRLQRVLARLDMQRLNLAGFSNVLKVRAAETKDDFPTRHSWDSYFRDAKHMNELKAGERPDTIHISGLPVKWFADDGTNTPNESLITTIFKKWGTIRRVDVPAADPYRSRMRLGNNIHKFSFQDDIFFDAYIQYVEYMDFVKAMDALRGMKLLKKDDQNSLSTSIKVDFDKTKHMSDNSVSHREFERKRLIAKDNLAAENLRKKEEAEKKRREEQKKKEEADFMAKESRQRKREEKRKRKALTIFRKQEEDKVSMKIAREEQKLIKAQRQLESIRLLDELFDRIKIKVEKKEIKLDKNTDTKKDEKKNDQANENNKLDSENDKTNKKEKQVKKKKEKKEKKKKKKRKKEQKKQKRNEDSGSNSTTEEDSDKDSNKKKLKSVLIRNEGASSSTGALVPTGFPYPEDYSNTIPMLPPIAPGSFHPLRMPMRYPGMQMFRPVGYSSIHHYPRRRGKYMPRCDMNSYAMNNPYVYNGQYYEYFTHLVNRDVDRRDSKPYNRRRSTTRSASRTRTRTRTKSRTKSRSISRSRSRRRSGSRSRSRGRRSKSRSRSRRTRSRSRSRSKSRSRRKSASRSVSRKRSSSKRRSSTRSRSRRRSESRSRSRTRRSRSRKKSRSRSRSRSRSSRYRRRRNGRSPVKITRAKSRTRSPKRMSRSSSWSMPKSPGQRSCSWSRDVPAINVNENVNNVCDKTVEGPEAKTAEPQKEAN